MSFGSSLLVALRARGAARSRRARPGSSAAATAARLGLGTAPLCCRTWSRARRRGVGTCPIGAAARSALSLLLVGFARPPATFHVSTAGGDASCSCSTSPARWLRTTRSRPASPPRRRSLRGSRRRRSRRATAWRSSRSPTTPRSSQPPTHDLTRSTPRSPAPSPGRRGRRSPTRSRRRCTSARSVQGAAGKRPPAVVVLLSDGGQTAGRVTPQQAAAMRARMQHPGVDGPRRHA